MAAVADDYHKPAVYPQGRLLFSLMVFFRRLEAYRSVTLVCPARFQSGGQRHNLGIEKRIDVFCFVWVLQPFFILFVLVSVACLFFAHSNGKVCKFDPTNMVSNSANANQPHLHVGGVPAFFAKATTITTSTTTEAVSATPQPPRTHARPPNFYLKGNSF